MKKSKRNYIRNVLTYLEPISKVPPKRRNNIVPLLSDETIHKLCESCQNFVAKCFGGYAWDIVGAIHGL